MTALSDDLLTGVPEIAAHIKVTERATYHLIAKGALPVFRLPGTKIIRARKSELERAFRAEAA